MTLILFHNCRTSKFASEVLITYLIFTKKKHKILNMLDNFDFLIQKSKIKGPMLKLEHEQISKQLDICIQVGMYQQKDTNKVFVSIFKNILVLNN